ncbi:MFS transporter [Rhizobium sp. BR 315]
MDKSGSDRRILLPLIVLSFAQLIGWGTVSFLSVTSREVAADLNVNISTVFAGTTVFYVTMGACAPLLSRFFTSIGARPVMIAGTVISALGLGLLSFSHSPVAYFLCWFLLGVAGSATLTIPAHILLNEIAGRNAARAIATLSLVSGLYGTVFWPLTSFLSGQIGWRGTCEVYALVMVTVCLPLYSFGLPRRGKTPLHIKAMVSQSSAKFYDRTFFLVVAAIALNAFITFGFSATLIELLKAEGLSSNQALAFGSALGVIQVGARGLNIILEKRWDGLAMGFGSSVVLCVSLAILLLAHGSTAAIATFLVLYGVSGGALAVARSTIPLVFYDKGDFAKALSRIALPLNWISAISPPVLISLMTNFGSDGVLILSLACSCSAIFVLLLLRSHRPTGEVVAGAS